MTWPTQLQQQPTLHFRTQKCTDHSRPPMGLLKVLLPTHLARSITTSVLSQCHTEFKLCFDFQYSRKTSKKKSNHRRKRKEKSRTFLVYLYPFFPVYLFGLPRLAVDRGQLSSAIFARSFGLRGISRWILQWLGIVLDKIAN